MHWVSVFQVILTDIGSTGLLRRNIKKRPSKEELGIESNVFWHGKYITF